MTQYPVVDAIMEWCDDQNVPYPKEIVVGTGERFEVMCGDGIHTPGTCRGFYDIGKQSIWLCDWNDLDAAWHEFLHHLGLMRYGDAKYYYPNERMNCV